ncbi:hypothetical protein AGIG_G7540 [Arapaima gigas]
MFRSEPPKQRRPGGRYSFPPPVPRLSRQRPGPAEIRWRRLGCRRRPGERRRRRCTSCGWNAITTEASGC